MSDEMVWPLIVGWLVVSCGVFTCQVGLSPFFEKRSKPWDFSELFAAIIVSANWVAPGSAISYVVIFVVIIRAPDGYIWLGSSL